jgi:hypothetical protein
MGDKDWDWKEIVVSAASAIEVATGTGHPTETGLEPTQLEQQYAEHREHQSEEEADEATELSFAIQEDRDRPAENDDDDNGHGGWSASTDDDDDDDDDGGDE